MNKLSQGGMRPLHEAAICGSAWVIRALVGARADPNALSDGGFVNFDGKYCVQHTNPSPPTPQCFCVLLVVGACGCTYVRTFDTYEEQ